MHTMQVVSDKNSCELAIDCGPQYFNASSLSRHCSLGELESVFLCFSCYFSCFLMPFEQWRYARGWLRSYMCVASGFLWWKIQQFWIIVDFEAQIELCEVTAITPTTLPQHSHTLPHTPTHSHSTPTHSHWAFSGHRDASGRKIFVYLFKKHILTHQPCFQSFEGLPDVDSMGKRRRDEESPLIDAGETQNETFSVRHCKYPPANSFHSPQTHTPTSATGEHWVITRIVTNGFTNMNKASQMCGSDVGVCGSEWECVGVLASTSNRCGVLVIWFLGSFLVWLCRAVRWVTLGTVTVIIGAFPSANEVIEIYIFRRFSKNVRFHASGCETVLV